MQKRNIIALFYHHLSIFFSINFNKIMINTLI